MSQDLSDPHNAQTKVTIVQQWATDAIIGQTTVVVCGKTSQMPSRYLSKAGHKQQSAKLQMCTRTSGLQLTLHRGVNASFKLRSLNTKVFKGHFWQRISVWTENMKTRHPEQSSARKESLCISWRDVDSSFQLRSVKSKLQSWQICQKRVSACALILPVHLIIASLVADRGMACTEGYLDSLQSSSQAFGQQYSVFSIPLSVCTTQCI